jgi:hypothetical protein
MKKTILTVTQTFRSQTQKQQKKIVQKIMEQYIKNKLANA